MLVLHDGLSREAEHLKHGIKTVFDLDIEIVRKNMDGAFRPLDNGGYLYAQRRDLLREFPQGDGKALLVLTGKDLWFPAEYGKPYSADDLVDAWIFGYLIDKSYDGIDVPVQICSTARIKGRKSDVVHDLQVPEELYHERLKDVGLHEMGHEIVGGQNPLHFKHVYHITPEGKSDYYYPHCPKGTCLMYESLSIEETPPSEMVMVYSDRELSKEEIKKMVKDCQILFGRQPMSYAEGIHVKRSNGFDNALQKRKDRGDDILCGSCRPYVNVRDVYRI